MITLCIRYTLDTRKRDDFERCAHGLKSVIPRCAEESGCILDRAFMELCSGAGLSAAALVAER